MRMSAPPGPALVAASAAARRAAGRGAVEAAAGATARAVEGAAARAASRPARKRSALRARRASLCALALLGALAPIMAAAADAERGRRLAERYHCGACHVIPGVPAARGRTAVSLAGFGRRSYIAGRLPNEPRLLERWLIDPAALVPGTAMPAMGVSPADARDMAAYLRSLR
jgi:cytochrome c